MTISYLKEIKDSSLESQIAFGDTYYKQGLYQKAIELYSSIQSTSIEIKQHLYYNTANAYVKLLEYNQAKEYYAKVLQLGENEDAKYNLNIIALLKNKKDTSLGMANPKSQSDASSKSEKKSTKESPRDENQPSSGNGGDKESKDNKNQEKKKLMSTKKEENYPLGSKVYELINEGYIYEKRPW